jgi:hypothetical protein
MAADFRGRRMMGDSMTRSDRNRRLNRVALAASLAIAIMMTMGLGDITVRAADDDENALPDQRFFQGVMKGLGLRRDGDGIEYRERSPLVLPPSRDLRPPETEASAKPPASWPKDPDVEYTKQVKAARAKPNINPEQQGPLKPSEYSVAGAPSRSSTPDGKPDSGIFGRPMSPAELGTQGIFKPLWGNKEEYSTFTSEPARSSLTEPPPGYRTPSPNQPYGVGKQKWTPTKTDKQEPVR